MILTNLLRLITLKLLDKSFLKEDKSPTNPDTQDTPKTAKSDQPEADKAPKNHQPKPNSMPTFKRVLQIRKKEKSMEEWKCS